MAIATPEKMEDIVARATQQRDLARAEALLLYGAELPALLSAATSLRDRCHGRRVTFSKKVFIPLTPLCRDYCGYCTFRRDPSEPGGRFLTPDEVLDLAQRARRAGCKEALFSLGDQPERVFPEAAE